nr:Serine threonine protein kinase-related domain containing protein [Haemonchus contortus]
MDDEEDEDLNLKPGTVVDSSKGAYVVVQLLGEGGFGAVYKVYDQKDQRKEYAMKVEKKLESRRHSKLKMEIAILKLVASERSNSHFTSIIDRGKKEKYFFLVMELVGQSLAALKMARPGKVFSISTGLGAGIQCLEACEDLHKYGFIHRDLKPANYAIGLADKRRTGTIRFASLACHRNIEMGPKDDCESWFYLLLDLIVPRGLLWKSVPDKNMVKKLKEDMRTTRRVSLKEVAFQGLLCKEQLMSVMDYLDSLQYQDRVDYEFIYKSLELGAKTAGGNIDLPYDWELGDDPTQTVTCAEQPRQKSTASRSRAKAKRKKAGTPGHSSQRKLKGTSSSGVNPAEVKSGAKEKSHAGSKENIKEARPQKGGTSERKSEGSKDKGRHGDKGFFSKSTPKRRAQKKLKSLKDPSSTSRALSIGVRKKNARKPSQKSRGRKPKKEASSSSSSERSGAGKEKLRRRWSTRLSEKIVGRRKDESQDSDSSEERAEAEKNTNQSINTGDVSL